MERVITLECGKDGYYWCELERILGRGFFLGEKAIPQLGDKIQGFNRGQLKKCPLPTGLDVQFPHREIPDQSREAHNYLWSVVEAS